MRSTIFAVICLFVCLYCLYGQETCKHCPTGAALDAQFPEAPSSVVLQSKHKTFSKLFLISHGIYLGSTIFDVHTSLVGESRGKCLEGHNGFPEHEGRGEMWGTELGIFGAVTALDALMSYSLKDASSRDRKIFGWMPHMGATYGTTKHLDGGIRWYTEGCM